MKNILFLKLCPKHLQVKRKLVGYFKRKNWIKCTKTSMMFIIADAGWWIHDGLLYFPMFACFQTSEKWLELIVSTMVQWAKPLLGMPLSHTGVPVTVLCLLWIQPYASVHFWRQQMLAQVLGSMKFTWETQLFLSLA